MMSDQSPSTVEPDRSSAAASGDDEQLESYTTAKARKDRFYRGRPCRNCCGTKRYTSSGSCVVCSAKHQRDYLRRHPERTRRHVREWAERNRDHVKAYEAALRERIRACDRERPEGLVITRKDAIEARYTTYYVAPCKAGHASGRYLDGACIDCSRVYQQAHRGGRTAEDRARDAEAARARREAKAAEKARIKAERERARLAAKAEREQARAAIERAPRSFLPRYEPRRIASPRLTDAERDAIERAKAERERKAAELRAAIESRRARRVEEAKARAEQRRELAAQRARKFEEARQRKQREVEAAKAAGRPHKSLARIERDLARAQVANERRATRISAPTGFSDDERAQIEAALAAGKVTRIEQGEWDDREESKRRW
jgi:hypothetical protein